MEYICFHEKGIVIFSCFAHNPRGVRYNISCPLVGYEAVAEEKIVEDITLREMVASDKLEVAELICISHNTWYQLHAFQAPFSGGPKSTELFFDAYEALDGSYGVVAENARSRRLAGLSFYHVRPTHVSVGMMSVHPNYFKRGVGKALLRYITDIADRQSKPVRLRTICYNPLLIKELQKTLYSLCAF